MNFSITPEDLKGFWIAFAISAIASFPIMKLLVAMKSRQTVSAHAPEGHQQKTGTPTMGGLIILAGFFGALPFVQPQSVRSFSETILPPSPISLIPIATLVLLFALIGFVDDFVVPRMFPGKRGLGWKQKILMQVVASAIPLLMGGYTSPVGLGMGVITILFFANAYNFSDGLDGLSGTLLIGLLLGMFGIAGQRYGPDGMGMLSYQTPILFVFFGALIPFLFWNAPKAKVFMGDVGSLPIGAFLAGFWLFCSHSQSVIAGKPYPGVEPLYLYIALAVWSLMMVAELVPVPLQIASVKLRKKKIFPYTPIHHAFEKAGWPETRVVFVFALLQLIFSMLAISIVAFAK